MARKILHLGLDVSGALMNWRDREFKGVFTDDAGRPLTAREAKQLLLLELAKGHKVIPCGKACEGFDYGGGGCPGHDVPEETAA